MVSSSSYRRYVQLLQRQYAILRAKGSRLGVGFSGPNTELIYSSTSRPRDSPLVAPLHLEGWVFHPRNELRWLGLWFTPSLSTTSHFTKRLAKALAAFVGIKLFSPPGMGLPHYLCHRLAGSLVFYILR